MSNGLQDICNLVARDLPEGFELRICLERGSGWVTLHNPEGDCLETDESDGFSIEERVMSAMKLAMTLAGEAP